MIYEILEEASEEKIRDLFNIESSIDVSVDCDIEYAEKVEQMFIKLLGSEEKAESVIRKMVDSFLETNSSNIEEPTYQDDSFEVNLEDVFDFSYCDYTHNNKTENSLDDILVSSLEEVKEEVGLGNIDTYKLAQGLAGALSFSNKDNLEQNVLASITLNKLLEKTSSDIDIIQFDTFSDEINDVIESVLKEKDFKLTSFPELNSTVNEILADTYAKFDVILEKEFGIDNDFNDFDTLVKELKRFNDNLRDTIEDINKDVKYTNDTQKDYFTKEIKDLVIESVENNWGGVLNLKDIQQLQNINDNFRGYFDFKDIKEGILNDVDVHKELIDRKKISQDAYNTMLTSYSYHGVTINDVCNPDNSDLSFNDLLVLKEKEKKEKEAKREKERKEEIDKISNEILDKMLNTKPFRSKKEEDIALNTISYLVESGMIKSNALESEHTKVIEQTAKVLENRKKAGTKELDDLDSTTRFLILKHDTESAEKQKNFIENQKALAKKVNDDEFAFL